MDASFIPYCPACCLAAPAILPKALLRPVFTWHALPFYPFYLFLSSPSSASRSCSRAFCSRSFSLAAWSAFTLSLSLACCSFSRSCAGSGSSFLAGDVAGFSGSCFFFSSSFSSSISCSFSFRFAGKLLLASSAFAVACCLFLFFNSFS